MKKILLLLLLALPCFVMAQSVVLTGKVTDPENLPLEAATVYLSSAKDSTLIEYTISDKSGKWELKTRAITTPVFLKVSFVGFSPFSQKLDGVTKNTDFGTMKMEDKGTTLGEVVIESEIPPVRVKKDTLEFNAASFNVRPDANLQELLKQLPGLEIDENGKMTINGKDVSQILVNGKPFFDKDGKIALQNLPAEIINKIQVTEAKTKEEEYTGKKASGNEASINITIDEEKNKGMFGRLTSGFGTDGRYEHSGLANYFKGDRKISILGSTNNINSTGFSMDEIFDNMSGGRNISAWSDGSSYNINGMQFGGGQGITRSDIIGANYADKWAKGFDGGLNYFYTGSDTKNDNQGKVTTFIPKETESAEDLSYVRENISKANQNRYGHYVNTQFEIKPDTLTSIYIEPRFQKAHNDSHTETTSRSYRLNSGQAMNDNSGIYANETNATSFNNSIVYTRQSKKKKGRFLSIDGTTTNEKGDGYNLNNTVTNNYTYTGGQQGIVQDIRNQVRNTNTAKDNYRLSVSYGQPVTDSSNVYLQVEGWRKSISENRRGFDFNGTSSNYDAYNDALSGYLSTRENTTKPSIGYSVNKNKFSLNLEGGAFFTDFNGRGSYMGQNFTPGQNRVLPAAEAQVQYSFTKSQRLYFDYSYSYDTPTPTELLPVADVINPLTTVIGNADLNFKRYHQVYLGLYNYNWTEKTGYSFYAGGTFYENTVGEDFTVDESARSTIKYLNISGTHEIWLGGNYGKTYKKDAHSYNFSTGLYAQSNLNKGFQNGEMYQTQGYSISPRVNFTYKYGELLTITPSYSFTYYFADYTNYSINTAESVTQRFSLATTSYWPKHIVFGNDFTYTYNSQQASFRKDFFLWNTSIGYNFWKDQLTFKVKVYDLLNQNLGASRTLTSTGISEQLNTVLKRYVMFSLSLKLDKFAGKKGAGAAEAAGSIIAF